MYWLILIYMKLIQKQYIHKACSSLLLELNCVRITQSNDIEGALAMFNYLATFRQPQYLLQSIRWMIDLNFLQVLAYISLSDLWYIWGLQAKRFPNFYIYNCLLCINYCDDLELHSLILNTSWFLHTIMLYYIQKLKQVISNWTCSYLSISKMSVSKLGNLCQK